jgi:hypothetical protein
VPRSHWIEFILGAYNPPMPTPRLSALALAGVLTMTVAAAAAQAETTDSRFRHRTEVTLGTLIGSGDIGSLQGPWAGVHLEAGKYFGSLALLAQYDFMGIGNAPAVKTPIRGFMNRVGLSGRYALGSIGKDFIRADLWLEGGVGREFVQWDAGGKLTRDDFTVGIGVQPMFTIMNQRFLGYYMAFRMIVAESPDAKLHLPSTCAGPCDEPTPPATTDMSFFFNFGITFGK